VIESHRRPIVTGRDALDDPGLVDVENPIGDLRLRLVKGDDVTGDRQRGRKQRCWWICYGEMLMRCVSCE
jgi:hypothetical protein